MKSVLACIDGSIYSKSVCAHAAWVSLRIGSPVELLHVLPEAPDVDPSADLSGTIGLDANSELLGTLAGLDMVRGQKELKEGREKLKLSEEQLRKAGVKEITVLKRRGELVETICEFETGKEIIVIGKRGALADEYAGHISPNLERIARAVQKPLLVAPNEFRSIKKFLIAFDGGASSTKALEYIVRTPLLKGVECHVVAVGKESDTVRMSLDRAVAELTEAGYSVHSGIKDGSPGDAIKAYVEANGIDLLVIGAYGHSRLRSLILGSTTTTVLMACRIPLLLCR